MGFKTVITVLYLAGAIIAGGVLAFSSPNADKPAVEIKEETLNASAENDMAQKQLKDQLNDALDKVSELDGRLSDLEAENENLREENEYLSAELIAAAEATEEEKEQEPAEEPAEEKTVEEPAEETIEEDYDLDEMAYEGASYTYTVKAEFDSLNLYDVPSGGSAVGYIPKGETGKVESLGADTDRRALIWYEGKTYYASKKYLVIKES
ncbi:MAG: hypothetical protein K6E56_02870 [Lachnospiraceae bacterium]|nr:hypothetical protein [Lachnospiraceae bacterium]